MNVWLNSPISLLAFFGGINATKVYIALAIVIAVALFVAVYRRYLRKPGRTVYLDKGQKSRTFRSKTHQVVAKPDRLKSAKYGKVVIHEYKSRKGPISRRDEVQVSVSAIAVRDSGYKVDKAVIEYGSGKSFMIDIESTRKLMSGEVGQLIKLVRKIKSGKVPKATPSPHKCRYCPYRESCSFAVRR